MLPLLEPAVKMSHRILQWILQPGDWAIDATAGNGHDTLFLAQQVGPTGRVLALDIQEAAITATQERLEAQDHAQSVTLHQGDHGKILSNLDEEWRTRLKAVVFNLGYLPGGDKSCTTQADSTLKALTGAARHLAPGGVIVVVCYVGHPGGGDEAQAVQDWSSGLDQTTFTVGHYTLINQKNQPPFLLVIERRP